MQLTYFYWMALTYKMYNKLCIKVSKMKLFNIKQK